MNNISILTRAPRLSDDVAEGLINAIHRNEFPIGGRLPPERELAERFGVSRVVVREAMARLKSEGLIKTRQGSGAFVSIDSEKVPFRLGAGKSRNLQSIFELRVAVESAAAALAASHATASDRAAIGNALSAMRRDVEAGRDGVEADNAFHAAIATSSQNPHMDGFIAFLGIQLKSTIAAARSNTAERLPQSVNDVQAEHERIFEAIVARNPAAAEAAMKLHLLNAMDRLKRLSRETTVT